MALSVRITKTGTIIIRLPKSTLKRATVDMPDLEKHDDGTGRFWKPQVTNGTVFAKEVFSVLIDEEDDGRTPVHRMLDEAIKEAIESGADGIRMPGEDDYSGRAIRT